MDIINLREWLFILVGVLAAGILIEGLRRWLRERNNPYEIAIGAVKLDSSNDDPIRHEIGGPARPVDSIKLETLINEDALPTQQADIEISEPKPDTEERKPAKADSFFMRPKKSAVTEIEKPSKPQKKKPKAEPIDLTTVPILIDPVEMADHDDEGDEGIGAETVDLSNEATSPQETEEEIQEAVVIYVFSRDANGFQGEPLLEALLASSLRYGDMSIFHRHQSPLGEGKVLFSVANAMNPGTFKIEAMNKFSTKGLSFFFGLPGPAKPIETFDLMLQTAQYLAKRLNGELKDEKRNVLTSQTIEHYRQRIRDFERRYLVQ